VPGFNRFYFTQALDGAVAGAINELTFVALGEWVDGKETAQFLAQ
jgi:hypothetical protein